MRKRCNERVSVLKQFHLNILTDLLAVVNVENVVFVAIQKVAFQQI